MKAITVEFCGKFGGAIECKDFDTHTQAVRFSRRIKKAGGRTHITVNPPDGVELPGDTIKRIFG